MERIELLAPAGSMESLIAAINKGADAIYLGGSKFSARAYASNFDEEELEKAVDYAHLYGVKVYITLNTLIKEKEFKEAQKYIGFLYRIGVDALIVQDLGIFKYIKDNYNDFEVHGSTQMTIHNGEAALYFKERGFHRIVLSRELTLKEIEYISKKLKVETEIFIHGALCISYSGQCLMSSSIGGRSGNRGRCAQSCRLPYTLINEEDNKKISGYLLSPKDICTVDNIKDIINTGAYSLKIEGRMKRPEYVAGVVESYRDAIDSAIKNKKETIKNKKDLLLQLFNREGFSKAFLYKNEGKDMMAYNMPKNTGVFLGSILSNGEIILEKDINLKDGIRNGEGGFTISKIIKKNKEVDFALKGETVRLFPKDYKKGDKLYKTSDVKLLEGYKTSYLNKFQKKIPLSIDVDFKIDNNIEISCSYNGENFKVLGELVQKPLKRPIDKNKLEENLKKSGETPFKVDKINFINFEEGFIPVSSINDVRRKLIEEIENNIIKAFKRNNRVQGKSLEIKERSVPDFQYIYEIREKEQLKALKNLNIENIIINPWGKNKEDISLEDLKDISKFYLKVPTIVKEEFNYICQIVNEFKEKIEGIVTSNVGIISKFKDDFIIIGDYKLNIFNKNTAMFYSEDINLLPLSVELNRKEIGDLLKSSKNNFYINIYGKVENMVMEYCPIGSNFGGKSSKKICSEPCKTNNFLLKDRMNEFFKVKTDRFCRAHLYNSVPTNLIGEKEDLISLGINKFKVEFVDENYEDTIKVINMIKGKEEIDSREFTKGHYKRGVQ
ncbi:U32 family peptidase [Clostridium fallax]|uniref:Putative protease n=1 Tax=Clostridium fallax TaxID=1533 RepID=A0A1M4WPN6_9CLOT|nr:U32 family peptidase [Clostridium fallax]SHE83196.1 putative protease [Clostridium fallax]SQB06262.1 peptidase U32 [Clostridium fallax]